MNSGVAVLLSAPIIKSNHQEGVRYHVTSPQKEQPLQGGDDRGSSLETQQPCDPSRNSQRYQLLLSLPLCELRQVLVPSQEKNGDNGIVLL